MALWGQGDPRWIVEEREDTKNVNNWHWSEVDASSSSKKFFKEKFLELSVTGTEGSVRVSEVTKCNGEATVNNRKGKVIYFYEWDLELKWCGKTAMSNDNITGKIIIENVSEENTEDEVDITTRQEKSGGEDSKLHQIVKQQLAPKCREIIGQYIQFLQATHGKQVVLPTKTAGQGINAVTTKPKPDSVNSIKKQMDAAVISKSGPKKTENVTHQRTEFSLKDTFKCRREELFQCFVNPDRMKAYLRGEADVDPRISGKFSLLAGAITGTYLEIQPEDKIQQHWRFKDWPADMFSSVTLTFKDTGSSTELTLHQTGVPQYSLDQIKEGWTRYYFQPIKMTFGYGAGSL